MLNLSFREFGEVHLWYCEGVHCVVLARGGSGGMLPQRKFAF